LSNVAFSKINDCTSKNIKVCAGCIFVCMYDCMYVECIV